MRLVNWVTNSHAESQSTICTIVTSIRNVSIIHSKATGMPPLLASITTNPLSILFIIIKINTTQRTYGSTSFTLTFVKCHPVLCFPCSGCLGLGSFFLCFFCFLFFCFIILFSSLAASLSFLFFSLLLFHIFLFPLFLCFFLLQLFYK